ncbi:unnamed protein product [Linum trigynum]|uniref:Uncharacterized protein n=1 Tax=Linum trigynum TaxID=586398 RepID=A0AAV2EAG6_9ROSI
MAVGEEQPAGSRRFASPRSLFTSKKLGGAGGWEEDEQPAERKMAASTNPGRLDKRRPPRQIPAASTSPARREEKDRCWALAAAGLRDGVGFCYVN